MDTLFSQGSIGGRSPWRTSQGTHQHHFEENHVFVGYGMMGVGANETDSHQHHFEERAGIAGGGVRAVGTNECVSTS